MSSPHLRSFQLPILRETQNMARMAGNKHVDWIVSGLAKSGKSKGGLAKALHLSGSQVTRLIQGKRAIKIQEVPIIADYIGALPPTEMAFETVTEVFGNHPDTVPLAGWVGAAHGDAEMHYYEYGQADFDEVPAPEWATSKTVAVEVRGGSLGEFFKGWLAFYDNVQEGIPADLLGRWPCVVGLPDGRVLIKRVKRGKNGLYDLYSNIPGEEPIRDVKPKWAALVKLMRPRWL